jgi:hypothetical protein
LAGPVHAKAIASTTDFCRVTGTRETTVGGGSLRATIDDVISTVTFLTILEAGIDEIFIATEGDTVFHGHVCGVGITIPCESTALDIIPTQGR